MNASVRPAQLQRPREAASAAAHWAACLPAAAASPKQRMLMQAAPVLPSPQHKREPETCKAQDVWCERSGQCVPYTVAATWLVCGSYMCVTRRKLQTPGTAKEHIIQVLHGESNTSQASPRMTIQCMCQPQEAVLHGESSTDQASPRTPTQRTFQPQEAVQPQRNQTILQADTPAQKANYPYIAWCNPI